MDKQNLIKYIQEKSESLFPKIQGIRRYLHQNPELSFEEVNTQKFIIEKLKEIGITEFQSIGNTGIVGIINPENKNLPCIALRADIDALPIIEQNDCSYKSQNKGVMHACGHDVHSSILLGTIETLYSLKNQLPYRIKFIFQPGEEKLPGGASILIKEGVLENPKVEKMIGLHVFPEMETGKIGLREGIYMASCDEIYITIKGKGGHAATPEQLVDPIVIGSTLVTTLQQIISRNGDPRIPSVLSFGHFEALGATNVVPSTAILKGTFRTLDEEWRAKAKKLIHQQVKNIVESMQGEVELNIVDGYPFLKNDNILTKSMFNAATEILTRQNVEELNIRMTSEDFAYYSQLVPSCFFRLGTRNEKKGIIHNVHNAKFDIDENALKTGIQTLAYSIFSI